MRKKELSLRGFRVLRKQDVLQFLVLLHIAQNLVEQL
jgi:hypothetical protein